jgi:hypothetical protein
MNEINFNSPTILTAKQYGRTVTIELDHSDTSIDEVMDGFVTILHGLGYLPSTINDYFKDKVMDIYEDEHQIVKGALTTEDDFSDWDENTNIDVEEEMRKYTQREKEYSRMDIIGQNGNEGLHYEENVWGSETEEDDVIEWSDEDSEKYDYKDISVEHPTFDWDGETNEVLDSIQRSLQILNERFDVMEEKLDDLETEVYKIALGPIKESLVKAKEVYDKSVVETQRQLMEKAKRAVDKWGDEVKEKHLPIKFAEDVVDWETGEVTKEDGGFNSPLYKQVRREPDTPVTEKKMDKSVYKKGKIKDLKK